MKRATKDMEEESNTGYTTQNTSSQQQKKLRGHRKGFKTILGKKKKSIKNKVMQIMHLRTLFLLHMFLPPLGQIMKYK